MNRDCLDKADEILEKLDRLDKLDDMAKTLEDIKQILDRRLPNYSEKGEPVKWSLEKHGAAHGNCRARMLAGLRDRTGRIAGKR